jgi:two-component system chemotaxis sensor kinase CheA
MPTRDISSYQALFLKDAKDHIVHIEALLLALETEPDQEETIKEIYRRAHSLKGASAVMGYNKITDSCTQIDLILKPKEVTTTFDPEEIKAITNLVSNIKTQVRSVGSGI